MTVTDSFEKGMDVSSVNDAVAEWVDAIWSKRTPDNPDGRIWQGFVAKHMPHGYVRFKSSPAFVPD